MVHAGSRAPIPTSVSQASSIPVATLEKSVVPDHGGVEVEVQRTQVEIQAMLVQAVDDSRCVV